MVFIPISLSLLALTAGMFLLAKTSKEDLGKFFKAISYFIIIVSFLIMCLSLIGGATRMCMRKMHHKNHEYGMHMQNRMPHKGRFSHHEGMERMSQWNKMKDHDEINTNENCRHDRWNDRSEEETKRFAEKLNLTSEQIKKVQEISKNFILQKEEQQNQINENRKKSGKLMRENKMEAIKKVLTPEQLKLFNESKENGMWHTN